MVIKCHLQKIMTDYNFYVDIKSDKWPHIDRLQSDEASMIGRTNEIDALGEAAFKEETQTDKSLHLTMITVAGVKRNEYSYLVHSQVRLDDLFHV